MSSLSRIQHIESVAFRKSLNHQVNPYCLAAWLRCGEIEAKKIPLQPFDKERLKGYIPAFRKLTREQPKIFVEEIKNKCAECGVAVVFVPHFKNTCAHGAAKWLNSNNAIIQLSLRYKWEDIFWFTFFHELGHIILHGKKDQFIEFDKESTEIKEKEANKYAQEELIPRPEFNGFIKEHDATLASVSRFAQRIGVSPAIVAGRLSYDTGDWNKWISLRRKLEFVSPAKKAI